MTLRLIGRNEHVPRPDFDVADFKDIEAPFEHGVIICNPPYGERLGEENEAEALYSEMSSLFEDFKGWEIGVITANRKFQECVGRYASILKDLKAGNLDTTFYIYSGNEKEKKMSADSAARKNPRKKFDSKKSSAKKRDFEKKEHSDKYY